MGQKSTARKPSHGASNAYKGLKKGTSASVGLNGVKWSKEKDEIESSGSDSTITAKTIKGSKTINQHKYLAINGKLP